jgi:prophage DNA circulation protein
MSTAHGEIVAGMGSEMGLYANRMLRASEGLGGMGRDVLSAHEHLGNAMSNLAEAVRNLTEARRAIDGQLLGTRAVRSTVQALASETSETMSRAHPVLEHSTNPLARSGLQNGDMAVARSERVATLADNTDAAAELNLFGIVQLLEAVDELRGQAETVRQDVGAEGPVIAEMKSELETGSQFARQSADDLIAYGQEQ